jgi:hypothetical protein
MDSIKMQFILKVGDPGEHKKTTWKNYPGILQSASGFHTDWKLPESDMSL